MGIKNIHIALISCSSILAFIFGIWGLNNAYQGLGVTSLIIGIGLIAYGVNFLRKLKNL